MSIPWYSLMWLPGTLLGVALGLVGAFIGVMSARGKLRRSSLTLVWVMLTVSATYLFAGLVALVTNKPWGIWYGLLLPGSSGLLVLGINLPVVMKRVREQSPAPASATEH